MTAIESADKVKGGGKLSPEPDPTKPKDHAISREPRQDRSKASFERMLAAAEALMVQRGSDDFTLIEVSQVGRVSIGSIYNRFRSKNELIQAVAARILARIESDQRQIVVRATRSGGSAIQLIKSLIGELGEFMKANAAVMRPLMLKADSDKVIQERGRIAHEAMVKHILDEILRHRGEMHHPQPERASRSCIAIAYASFARDLSFGMIERIDDEVDWNDLKQDLGTMVAAFLVSDIARG